MRRAPSRFHVFSGVPHGQQTLRGQSALFLSRRRPAADLQPVRLRRQRQGHYGSRHRPLSGLRLRRQGQRRAGAGRYPGRAWPERRRPLSGGQRSPPHGTPRSAQRRLRWWRRWRWRRLWRGAPDEARRGGSGGAGGGRGGGGGGGGGGFGGGRRRGGGGCYGGGRGSY